MTTRRRLLVVLQPGSAGVARHVVDVLSLIDRNEYLIDVACPRGSHVWNEVQAQADVRLHPFSAVRRPAPSDVAHLFRLLPLVRGADVVHAHSSKAGVLVRLAAALTGKARHCLFTPHAWSFWSASGLVRKLYQFTERRAARWCHAILTVSEFERESGLAAGIRPRGGYQVIPNGVDLARFGTTRRPVAGRIVVLGRLAPQKRPELAIQAFAALRPAHPGAELHLVGDGPDRLALERLVHSLGLEHSVRFLGERGDVADILAEATCVLLTSEYEGCPLSVIEAMAAGVPVVATNVGGLEEILSHNKTGLLVDSGSQAIAAALSYLLTTPEGAAAMGQEARTEAHLRFGRPRMVSSIVDVYERIAAPAERAIESVDRDKGRPSYGST